MVGLYTATIIGGKMTLDVQSSFLLFPKLISYIITRVPVFANGKNLKRIFNLRQKRRQTQTLFGISFSSLTDYKFYSCVPCVLSSSFNNFLYVCAIACVCVCCVVCVWCVCKIVYMRDCVCVSVFMPNWLFCAFMCVCVCVCLDVWCVNIKVSS